MLKIFTSPDRVTNKNSSKSFGKNPLPILPFTDYDYHSLQIEFVPFVQPKFQATQRQKIEQQNYKRKKREKGNNRLRKRIEKKKEKIIWVKNGDPCGGENSQPCCFQFRGKGWEISNFFYKIMEGKNGDVAEI